MNNYKQLKMILSLPIDEIVVSIDVRKHSLSYFLEQFKIRTVQDCTQVRKFDLSKDLHRSLLLSVYSIITKNEDWPGTQDMWRLIGVNNTDALSYEFDDDYSVFMLLGMLYYGQRYSDSPYFHSGIPPSMSHIKEINEIALDLVRRSQIKELSELFYTFGILLEEDTVNHLGNPQTSKATIEGIHIKNLVKKLQFNSR